MFLIQSDCKDLSVEKVLWTELCEAANAEYKVIPSDADISGFLNNRILVPLGEIGFTNRILKAKYGINQMNPVEAPKCLRTPFFLGRAYNITPFDKVPQSGSYFLKDASELKRLTCFGNKNTLIAEHADPNHNFVVSEVIDILAEYRVYIVHGDIYAIEYYNGDPCIFPDVKKIQQANLLYSAQPDYPKSYTIDVAVTEDGTFIVEVQPVLLSVGLYTTMLSTSFLRGYEDAIDYLTKYNSLAEIS